jgi:nucleoside-diphosphate-sugar epimerase
MRVVMEVGSPGSVYNIGNPRNSLSVNALADVFVSVTGAAVERVDPVALHGPAFREAPDKVAPDIGRIRALGWEPRYGIDAIVHDVVRTMDAVDLPRADELRGVDELRGEDEPRAVDEPWSRGGAVLIG